MNGFRMRQKDLQSNKWDGIVSVILLLFLGSRPMGRELDTFKCFSEKKFSSNQILTLNRYPYFNIRGLHQFFVMQKITRKFSNEMKQSLNPQFCECTSICPQRRSFGFNWQQMVNVVVLCLEVIWLQLEREFGKVGVAPGTCASLFLEATETLAETSFRR